MRGLTLADPAFLATAAGFSPASLSPVVWFDASDATTIVSSAGKVSQWNDKSGLGRNVTQATSTNQPTTASATQNGLNVLVFDGNDSMTYDAGSDIIDFSRITFFVVARGDSPGIQPSFYRTFASRRNVTTTADFQAPNYVGHTRQNANTLNWNNNGTAVSTSIPYSLATTFLSEGRFNGSSMFHRINNGTEYSTAAAQGALQRYFRVAGGIAATAMPATDNNGFWNGRIAELVIFNADLTTTQRDQVRAYLNTKWAVY